MHARCTARVLLFGILVAPTVHAGVIRGRVHVPTLASASGSSAGAYAGSLRNLPGSHAQPRGAVTDVVIYVVNAPEGWGAELRPAPARLAQRDQSFIPRSAAVAVGGSVEFPNEDPIFHNVFSVSATRRFDLGKYPRGRSKSVTFEKTGLVKVYCDIHSSMEAFVLVVPNPCFTRPGEDGSFALPDLPPGSYVLKLWHPDFEDQERRVEVPASGDVTVGLGW